MAAITYRSLDPDEIHLLATIDRSEVIDGRYAVVDGTLALSTLHHVVTGWYPCEVSDHVVRLHQGLAGGGCAFGARHGPDLVGLATLVIGGVGGDPLVMQLEPLHVSAAWRNQGIGKALVAMIADAARSLGATSLYISSIPTRNTVDAYMRMGAKVLERPDPDLFAQEPEDIHLVLAIEPFLRRSTEFR